MLDSRHASEGDREKHRYGGRHCPHTDLHRGFNP